jgi:hypothetical protein
VSVDIRVGERTVNVHHPKLNRMWEHGDIVYLTVTTDGTSVTLFLGPDAFRDIMAKGREITAARAARLRAELEAVEALTTEDDAEPESAAQVCPQCHGHRAIDHFVGTHRGSNNVVEPIWEERPCEACGETGEMPE